MDKKIWENIGTLGCLSSLSIKYFYLNKNKIL